MVKTFGSLRSAKVEVEHHDPGFELEGTETMELSSEAGSSQDRSFGAVSQAIYEAKTHLSLPHSPTERELDQRRTRELVERIKGGVWLPCSWATVEYAGREYRMNGQHSAHAIIEAEQYLPEKVVIHFDSYRASNREGMALLFRQFDARFSGRTKQDVAGAYQGLTPEIESIDRKKAKLGIEGVSWYERNFEQILVPPSDNLYELFFTPKYHPFLHWVNQILSSKTRELNKTAVVAAMHGTYLKSESGSQDFWEHVAKQDVPNDCDPRMFLGRHLQQIYDEKRKERISPAAYFCKCITAWNAFRAGKDVRSLNVNPKKGFPEIAE